MGPGHGTWTCRKCGRRSEVSVAPDASGRCERCIETAGFERPAPGLAGSDEIGDDARRRQVIARLRASYAEARDLVEAERPEAPPHAHLEWILGARRHPDRDDTNFETGFSELMVLWLDDLVLELDGPVPASFSSGVARLVPAGGSRESAASGLRSATRAFAEAFLTRRAPTAVDS
jgi:hypothetical protein